MLTNLVALSAMAVPAPAPPFVDPLAGNLNVVQGILTANKTPNNTPQSITLNVGGTNHTYANIYLVGSASQNFFIAGTQVTIILAQSSPLKANYSALQVYVDQMMGDVTTRRTVPMSQGGTLHYGVAVANYARFRFMLPSFNLAGFNFANGCTASFSAFPPSWSIPFPTVGGATSATVWFRSTEFCPFNFQFSATGPNTMLLFKGGGTPRSLLVQGSLQGAATTLGECTFFVSDDDQ